MTERPLVERLGRCRFGARGWVETNFDRCFKVMKSPDEGLLHEWADHWRDLVDFEFVPVMTSMEAASTADRA